MTQRKDCDYTFSSGDCCIAEYGHEGGHVVDSEPVRALDKLAHTLGPWRVSKSVMHKPDCPQTCNADTHTNLLIQHGDSETFSPLLAEVYCDEGRLPRDANAKLIAAAPELLEALQGLFEHCAMVHKHWGENSNQREADAAIAAGRAAIAKAGGE